jgi:hypothetical protein
MSGEPLPVDDAKAARAFLGAMHSFMRGTASGERVRKAWQSLLPALRAEAMELARTDPIEGVFTALVAPVGAMERAVGAT